MFFKLTSMLSHASSSFTTCLCPPSVAKENDVAPSFPFAFTSTSTQDSSNSFAAALFPHLVAKQSNSALFPIQYLHHFFVPSLNCEPKWCCCHVISSDRVKVNITPCEQQLHQSLGPARLPKKEQTFSSSAFTLISSRVNRIFTISSCL